MVGGYAVRRRRAMPVARSRGYSGLVSAGVGAVGALYRGYKQYKGLKKAFGKNSTNSAPLTTQYDARRLYTYKRMSRRKRKRWVSFIKKVKAASSLLANNYLSYTSTDAQAPAAGSQAFGYALIYGINGITPGHGNDDLYKIVPDLNFFPNKQFRLGFKSATLDAEWSAASTNTGSITLDIYEVVVRKDISKDTSNNLSDLFFEGIQSLTAAAGSGTALSATQVGVTPFMSKLFCQNVKILGKTRILMSPGQTCHKEIRDPKNRTLQWTDQYNHILGKSGWTRGFFWIAEAVTDGTVFSPAFRINYANVRNYNVQYDSPSDPQGGRD